MIVSPGFSSHFGAYVSLAFLENSFEISSPCGAVLKEIYVRKFLS